MSYFKLIFVCLMPCSDVTNLSVWISSLDRAFRKITSTIKQQMHLYNFHLKHFKHLKPLRHVSIFSDHHQGVSSFLAKVITYSRFSSFLQTRCCGSISCCVGICCRECSWLGVRRTDSYTTWYAATTPCLQKRTKSWICNNFSKERRNSLMMIWKDRNMSEWF